MFCNRPVLCVLSLISLLACQPAVLETAATTPDFQVQALNANYLGRKTSRWVAGGAASEAQLVKELDYARVKHPALMKQLVQDASHPQTFFNSLNNPAAVQNRRQNDMAFNAFMDYLMPAPPMPATWNNGLMAFYPFSGNANDSSGNGNHGTLMGSPGLTTDRNGQVGKAYQFNGAQYIRLADSPTLSPTAGITISLWYYVSQLSHGGNLVSKWGDSGAWSGQRSYNTSMGNGNFHFGHSDGGNQGNASYHAFSSGQITTAITWHQVIFTYDGSTRRIYLDGAQKASISKPGSILDGIARIGIGGLETTPSSSQGYFTGKIDDVRIYNRALTAAEVAAFYAYESAVS